MSMAKSGAQGGAKVKEQVLTRKNVNVEGDLCAGQLGERRTCTPEMSGCVVVQSSHGALAGTPPSKPGAVAYNQNFDSTTTGTLPSGWTSYGDATWVVSASNPHSGLNCVINQDVADNQSSSLVYSSSLDCFAQVQFWWDVESEDGWDYLSLYVNEVLQDEITGAPGYAEHTVIVPPLAALRWEFNKDGSGTDEPDQGYVDDFSIRPIIWEAGDVYYNTAMNMEMYFDGSRVKWLSTETAEIVFGSGCSFPHSDLSYMIPSGSYFTGSSGVLMSATSGRIAEYNGTIISMGYSRPTQLGTVPAFAVTADGTIITSVVTDPAQGTDLTLSGDLIKMPRSL